MEQKQEFVITKTGILKEYNGTADVVIIPEGVTEISEMAFSIFKKFHLKMSIHCPSWKMFGEAKCYAFASSIIARSGSMISFRDDIGKIVAKVILANSGETDLKKNLTYLSIRSENGRFDFKGYDKTFALLGQNLNKIDIAIVRVLYPYELSDEMLEVYQTFLKKKAFLVGCMLIDKDDLNTMDELAQKGIFSKNALTKLIDYSSEKQKISITAWLLKCKNEMKQDIKGKEGKKVSKEKKESKHTSLWKKPKAGTNTVARYLGEEESVQFPLEVEGISIEGISNTAGKTPENYKKIKHIVLPEGYLYIGNKAFAGCEALETIVLPSTLKEMGSQAFAECKNLKEIVLSEKIDFFWKQYICRCCDRNCSDACRRRKNSYSSVFWLSY